MKTTKTARISFTYLLAVAASVLASWVLHELTHWIVGTAAGNDMSMTLNATFPVSHQYRGSHDHFWVDAAGPFVTVLEAVLAYGLLKRTHRPVWFAVLTTCFYMRLLAAALNFINLNDEGRLSRDLGLGVWTLAILVTSFLFYLMYKSTKREGYRASFLVATLLLIMLFSSILILADQAVKITLLG